MEKKIQENTQIIKKWIIMFIISILTVVCVNSLGVQAEECGAFVVTGGTNGTDYSYENSVLTIKTSTPITISTKDTTYTDHIVIQKDVSANVTLKGVDMQFFTHPSFGNQTSNYFSYTITQYTNAPALLIEDDSNGDVTITVEGYNFLYGLDGAAIQKNGAYGSLTINGTGNLYATSCVGSENNRAAAIGSSQGKNTSNITIATSGQVSAASYSGGAGIGGGCNGNGDNILIKSGTIYACSHYHGAGIGGGKEGDGKNISILSGNIIATSGYNYKYGDYNGAAGIGGGYNGDGENILISGGTVKAQCIESSYNGAGIGGGFGGCATNIHITGGEVTATGGAYSAGIGSGGVNPMHISSGCVKGENSITIDGGVVNATGSMHGAGIGGGYGRDAIVTINGGKVTATTSGASESESGGTGIGGGGHRTSSHRTDKDGNFLTCSSIVTITGGTITATGDCNAAGIGEAQGIKGIVYISGGSINATAGTGADAVGSGSDGDTATVQKSETDNTNVYCQKTGGFTADELVSFTVKDSSGNDYEYGIKDVYADSDGMVYPYVPENSTIISSTVEPLTITSEPTIIGTYGTAVKDMTISGGVVKRGNTVISGTWSADSTDVPVVGGNKAYTVTFTPGTSSGETVTCEVIPTVSKATISLKDVSWQETTEFSYDGNVHSVELQNVPDMVNVTYGGNSEMSAVGNYTTTATFSLKDSQNYEIVDNAIVECHWSIIATEATKVTLSSEVVGVDAVYDNSPKVGYSGNIRWYKQGTDNEVTVSGTTITYQGTGDTQYNSTEAPKNAGTYQVVFDIEDTDGYEAISKTIEFTIEKASYDMSNVTWDYPETGYVYDGAQKEITISNLPDGVEVDSYTGNKATNAGTYQATASFKVSNSNYSVPESQTKQWEICKATISLKDVSWQETTEFSYDGNVHSVELQNVPDMVSVTYGGDIEKSAVGSYETTATFSVRNSLNYELENTTIAACNWSIIPTTIELSTSIVGENAIYDKSSKKGYSGNIRWYKQGTNSEVTGLETIISYQGTGNTQYNSTEEPINAGTYQAVFDIEDTDGYEAISKTIEFTIEKASYDMSNVTWDYLEAGYVYDGAQKEITISNLPDGVEIDSYTGNKAINSGTYQATASFKVSDSNYSVPESQTKQWEICKATISLKDVSWQEDTTFAYDGTTHSVVLQNIPDMVNVTYGEDVEKSAVGNYVTTATLSAKDNQNYELVDNTIGACHWSIISQDAVIVTLSPDVAGENTVYDGNRAVGYTGDVKWYEKGTNNEVTGLDTIISYQGTGDTQYNSTEAPTNAGTYQVLFEITENDRYVAVKQAISFTIEKNNYDMSNVTWDYSENGYLYDGSQKEITISNLPDGVEVDSYTGNKATNAGTYQATVSFKVSDSNYNVPEPQTKQWKICKVTISLKDVSWQETTTFTYDGATHSVVLQNVPDMVNVTYGGNVEMSAVGNYTTTATFSVKDSQNYELVDYSIAACSWSIIAQETTMVTLSKEVVGVDAEYNGNVVKGYTGDLKWYRTDTDEEVTGLQTTITYQGTGGTQYNSTEAPINAGTYQAVFGIKSTEGYAAISTAVEFTIQKATISLKDVSWQKNTIFTYDGTTHSVVLQNVPDMVNVTYGGNVEMSAVGDYTTTATFSAKDSQNYELVDNYVGDCTWSIVSSDDKDDDKDITQNPDDDDSQNDDDKNDTDDDSQSDDDGNDTDDDDTDTDDDLEELSDGDEQVINGYNYQVNISDDGVIEVEMLQPINTKTKKVVIPSKVLINGDEYPVVAIAKNAFKGNKYIQSVTIPSSVRVIGKNAFANCKNLTTVKMGSGLKEIASGTFSGCSKLKTVTIGSNVTKIGDKAFYKCTSLTKITIPSRVTTIGNQAFYGDKRLKTITIKSKKLKKIGKNAWKGIYKKATIKCPNKKIAKQYKKKLFKSKTGYKKTMKIK